MNSTHLLNSLVMRTLRKPLAALSADDNYAVMRMAEVLWTAYAEVLKLGPWPALGGVAVETAITSNRLARADLDDPLHVVVWNQNPVPANPCARVLPLQSEDSTYFHFYNGTTSPVWVRTWPQAPVFVPTGEDDMAVGVAGGVIYVHTTRKFYQDITLDPDTLISTYADDTKWTADPEIWGPAAAYIRLAAQQDQLGNMEQERGQARELERQKDDEISRLFERYLADFLTAITNNY